MQLDQHEEKLLRAVAFQNAKAVLMARERAERDLVEANQRIANILEAITDGFVALDTEWRFIFVNQRAEEIFRPLQKTRSMLLGQSHWDAFPDTVGTPLEAEYRRAVRENVTVQFENFYPPLNVWFEIRAYPSPQGLSIYFQDISERKEAGEALRASEAQSQAIFHQAAVGIALAELDGRFAQVNRKFTEILGYSAEELCRMNAMDLTHPDDLSRTREQMHKVLAGEISHYVMEKRYVHKTGREVWSLTTVTLTKDAAGTPHRFIGVIEDITARKQAEQQLLSSGERLQLALAAGGLGDWEWESASDLVTIGQRTAEIFGLPHRPHTWTQMRDALHPDDRERARLAVERALADRTDYNIEYRVIHPAGNVAWVASRGRGKYAANGDVLGMSGMVADITERKRAEEARSRLAAVVESSDDAIISMDLNTCITTWNKGAERTFGYTADEVVGKSITILIPSSREDEEPAILEKLKRGERIDHYETERVRKDGQLLHVSLSVSPLRDVDGRIVGVSKISRDITARRETEAKLRRSEEELRAMANSIPQLAWMAEPDGNIFWYNQRWYEYTGTTLEQMRGWGWKELHDPKILPSVIERWNASLSTGAPFDMEFPLRGADGAFRWFLTRVNPVRDNQGHVTRWFGTNTDVDFVRKAQVALEEETRILELLNDTGKAIASQLELQALVQIVTDAATKLCGAKFGAFFYATVDARGEALILYTLSGAPREAFERFGHPRATPLFGPTFRGEGVIRSGDILLDPRYGKMAPHHGMPKGHLPVRSYLSVPVISRSGEVIGGLFFGHPDTDIFNERSERLIVGIAAQAAVAIDNARLYESAQKQIAERTRAEKDLAQRMRLTAARAEISAALAGNEDMASVLNRCTDTLVTHFDAAFARIWALNNDTLELQASSGMYTHLDGPHSSIPLGQFKIGRIAQSGKPHLTNDVQHDPNISNPEWARIEGMVAFAGYPLAVGARVSGVIALFSRQTMGEEVLRELSLIADGVAQWIQRKDAENALRQAQEELSHHADELEKQVNLRTVSLREAIAQLEEFSYSVSHDLRAPLRAIAGYTQIFQKDFGEALPAPAHVFLDKISRSTERMQRLVNDVLTMSRVARAEIDLHPVGLQRFIEEIVEQHPEMQTPRADISIETPHSVIADEASLGQVVQNLLANAVKFVPHGQTPIIRVRSESHPGGVRIWLEDNGIGIKPEHRDKLFGMFQRLTVDTRYEGTGIGLAIVRKAVERMGGTVGVESGTGIGSRFWVDLKGPE